MSAKTVPEWEIPARDLYREYPQRQRDEAVRTGTFGAAAMIYAARALGLGSTPMIGFDAEAVAREFALAEDEVPVMLLSVGAALPRTGRRSRAARWPMCWNSLAEESGLSRGGRRRPRSEQRRVNKLPDRAACSAPVQSAASLRTRWPPTTSSPFSTVTLTVSPSLMRPSRISVASGFCRLRWITRLSGRAP